MRHVPGDTMNLLAVSCSNVIDHRNRSASTRVCQLVAEMAEAERPGVRTTILPLVDLELHPCTMCGACLHSDLHHCPDTGFNTVLDAMVANDAIVLVVPHYAGIPAKLVIALEKLQELTFLLAENACQHESPLVGKPCGIVAHGGMVEEPDVLEYYRKNLLGPLRQAVGGIGMKVVGAGAGQPWGVTFGITGMTRRPGSFVSEMEHDWDRIRTRLAPLVSSILDAAR